MYTIEPLKTGISANQNSLETEQLARSLFFTFYLHCIKNYGKPEPPIPETGQAFYHF